MSAPVNSGDVLAGKYRVERVLGQGGMGIVVQATHLQLGQRVALKFLLHSALNVPEAIERFLREARAAVQIRGEHVARVTDVGTLESGSPYMVMEYLHGSDLSAVLHDRGPLPISEAADYVLQTCEALAEAHSLGIVHRDLKPANLFLTKSPDGSALVKVLDFGISKAIGQSLSASAASLTATSAVIGSPLYMSPEQITSSRDVDHRTDIWSLGIILHELVAGSPPFHAETAPALLVTIAVSQPAPLRTVRQDAPAELEAVVTRCLTKDRNLRYSNVAELAWALQPFASEVGRTSVERVSRMLGVRPAPNLRIISGPIDPGRSTGADSGSATQSAWGTTSSNGSHRRLGLIGALALVGVLALVGLVLALRNSGGAGSASANAPAPALPVLNEVNPPPVSSPAQPVVAPERALEAKQAPAEPEPPSSVSAGGARSQPRAAPPSRKLAAKPRAAPAAALPNAAVSARPRPTPVRSGREIFDDIE